MTDEILRQQIRQQHAVVDSPFSGSGFTPVDSPHLSNPVSIFNPASAAAMLRAAGLFQQYTAGNCVQVTCMYNQVYFTTWARNFS